MIPKRCLNLARVISLIFPIDCAVADVESSSAFIQREKYLVTPEEYGSAKDRLSNDGPQEIKEDIDKLYSVLTKRSGLEKRFALRYPLSESEVSGLSVENILMGMQILGQEQFYAYVGATDMTGPLHNPFNPETDITIQTPDLSEQQVPRLENQSAEETEMLFDEIKSLDEEERSVVASLENSLGSTKSQSRSFVCLDDYRQCKNEWHISTCGGYLLVCIADVLIPN